MFGVQSVQTKEHRNDMNISPSTTSVIISAQSMPDFLRGQIAAYHRFDVGKYNKPTGRIVAMATPASHANTIGVTSS